MARVVYLMFVISVLVDDLDGVLVCTMCSEVMGWWYRYLDHFHLFTKDLELHALLQGLG